MPLQMFAVPSPKPWLTRAGNCAPCRWAAPAWRMSIRAISRVSVMRREGSPWTGVGTIFRRELADNLLSVRMRLLEILVVLTGTAAVYAAIGEIKNSVSEDPFV